MSLTSGRALDAVHAFLVDLEATGRASAAVRRQRSWALREAVLFAAVRTMRDVTTGQPLTTAEREAARTLTSRVTLTDLLAPGFATEWTSLADPVLRGVTEPNVSTQRARIASLRALAAFTGGDVPAHQAPKAVLRGLLTEPEIDSAMLALTQQLPGRGPDDHVRLAAILAVMSVWPARSVELSAMRLAQVRPTGGRVLLHVTTPDDGDGEPLVLTGVAAERLRQWLAVRDSIVSALQGGPVHALWTSIRSNSRPGGPRGSLPLPPGMPLKPRGLQRAYARAVLAANLMHEGLPGFPLPKSLDLLRRSIGSGTPRPSRPSPV